MGPANLAGAGPIDISELPRLTSEELLKAIAGPDWVIDLRSKDFWAQGHLQGTLNFGSTGSFATYLGWLFPYERELILISDKADEIAVAQRELVRIGIDRPKASFLGNIDSVGETITTELVKFSDVPAILDNDKISILDVRRNSERNASHIAGSIHIPLHELSARISELPADKTIWVHCAGAYRAAIAAGLLQNAGLDTVLINESYEKVFEVAGLPLISGGADLGPIAPSDIKVAN